MARAHTSRRPVPEQEIDPLIPILNLVCMLIPLLLYGAVFMRYFTVDVRAARPEGIAEQPDDEALALKVGISAAGFHIGVAPRHRLPWMRAALAGDGLPDIPRLDDGYDFAALRKRIAEIKALHRGERRLLLVAEDDVPFEVLLKAMDFTREDDGGELFPDVTLSRQSV